MTIRARKGLFQYQRLVFGVTSSPAIWQRAMDQALQRISRTQCILDDMIITGMSNDEQLERLEKVLERLQEAGLRENKWNCEFFAEEAVWKAVWPRN